MENLKRTAVTGISLALYVLLLAISAYSFFSGEIRGNESLIQSRDRIGAEYRVLLAHKTEIESLWQSRKPLLADPNRPEEALNFWVKTLLDFSQKEGIVFQKLEPQGVKNSGTLKEMQLFVLFEGDIRKLIRLLHYLYEKDAFSKVTALSVASEEDAKTLKFELTLSKMLP